MSSNTAKPLHRAVALEKECGPRNGGNILLKVMLDRVCGYRVLSYLTEAEIFHVIEHLCRSAYNASVYSGRLWADVIQGLHLIGVQSDTGPVNGWRPLRADSLGVLFRRPVAIRSFADEGPSAFPAESTTFSSPDAAATGALSAGGLSPCGITSPASTTASLSPSSSSSSSFPSHSSTPARLFGAAKPQSALTDADDSQSVFSERILIGSVFSASAAARSGGERIYAEPASAAEVAARARRTSAVPARCSRPLLAPAQCSAAMLHSIVKSISAFGSGRPFGASEVKTELPCLSDDEEEGAAPPTGTTRFARSAERHRSWAGRPLGPPTAAAPADYESLARADETAAQKIELAYPFEIRRTNCLNFAGSWALFLRTKFRAAPAVIRRFAQAAARRAAGAGSGPQFIPPVVHLKVQMKGATAGAAGWAGSAGATGATVATVAELRYTLSMEQFASCVAASSASCRTDLLLAFIDVHEARGGGGGAELDAEAGRLLQPSGLATRTAAAAAAAAAAGNAGVKMVDPGENTYMMSSPFYDPRGDEQSLSAGSRAVVRASRVRRRHRAQLRRIVADVARLVREDAGTAAAVSRATSEEDGGVGGLLLRSLPGDTGPHPADPEERDSVYRVSPRVNSGWRRSQLLEIAAHARRLQRSLTRFHACREKRLCEKRCMQRYPREKEGSGGRSRGCGRRRGRARDGGGSSAAPGLEDATSTPRPDASSAAFELPDGCRRRLTRPLQITAALINCPNPAFLAQLNATFDFSYLWPVAEGPPAVSPAGRTAAGLRPGTVVGRLNGCVNFMVEPGGASERPESPYC